MLTVESNKFEATLSRAIKAALKSSTQTNLKVEVFLKDGRSFPISGFEEHEGGWVVFSTERDGQFTSRVVYLEHLSTIEITPNRGEFPFRMDLSRGPKVDGIGFGAKKKS